MTQEEKKTAPEAPPLGLDFKQARDLISTTHNAAIPENDPLLMIVTILNAYLGEVQKLHARHEEGLTKLMAEKTGIYVQGVQDSVKQLSDSLSSASLQGIRAVLAEQADTLKAFKQAVFYAAGVVAVSALVNVAVFVLKAVR
jgi:heterodisulfide reductase subunit A-like polyferredoxin